MITPENPAVLVRDFKTDKTFIITRSDVIRTTGASWPWNLSTVPTRTPVDSSRSASRLTCAL